MHMPRTGLPVTPAHSFNALKKKETIPGGIVEFLADCLEGYHRSPGGNINIHPDMSLFKIFGGIGKKM